MQKSSKFLSLPVVSLEEGKEIGRVRSLVINPQTGEVAALIIQQGSFFREQKVIPYPRVISAGSNALTIQKASSAEKMASLPQIVSLIKDDIQLKGCRVITEGGTALGYVEEFYVDPDSGRITAYEIGGGLGERLLKGHALLPAEEVRTIGKDVLVVHNGAQEALTPVEGRLTEGLKTLKERVIKKAWRSPTQAGEDKESPAPEPAPPSDPGGQERPPGGQD